jgi:hypothetical protein
VLALGRQRTRPLGSMIIACLMPFPLSCMQFGLHSRLCCFKDRDPKPIGERFRKQGRMLPEGVTYQASWMDSKGVLCFQLIEATGPEQLTPWIRRWEDLIDFEVVPVTTSAEFWSKIQPQ